MVEAREIAQSNIAIALHAVSRLDPERYPAMIMNAVLGRGMSSRLFKEVRERRGLAYAIGSGLTRYMDTGVLSISAGVSPENVAEATTVIKAELMKLVDEKVGEEELTKARDYTIGSFRLGLETPMALAQRAGEQLLMLGEIEPIDDVVAKLAAVTRRRRPAHREAHLPQRQPVDVARRPRRERAGADRAAGGVTNEHVRSGPMWPPALPPRPMFLINDILRANRAYAKDFAERRPSGASREAPRRAHLHGRSAHAGRLP